jgi:hypothetical protein
MRGWTARFSALVAPVAVAAFAWTGPALAAPPNPCASVMPLADVTAGMVGTGWTVTQGTDPGTFDVEVLGVVPGLVAPGRDVIVAKISGPVVDEGGGVWFGMSGSPVYVGSDLIGAVAYGFSLGPSDIVGLTPAQDMLTIAGYPASTARKLGARVPLSRSMRTVIARSTGAALATVDDSLVRLKIPVSVSGVSSDRMAPIKKLLARRNVAAIPYAGSAVSASAVSSIDSLVPGGNFAAALSYGDITIAGVGTTTYVCDGMALAFGHPLLLTGKSGLGAGGADAVAIVKDPVLSAFKLANVTAPLGKLDQDRIAGVRAVDGEVTTIPVESAVSSLDTGLARVGQTDVVLASEFPILAFTHVFANIDTVFDAIGAGSSTTQWTINGTHADGSPWQLHLANQYSSEYDISIDSSIDMLSELETIAFNPFEKAKFTGVEATVSVEDTPRYYELTDLLVCRRGVCAETDTISGRRGQTIRLQAILTPSDGSDPETVDFAFTIPERARAGALIEIGDSPGFPQFCFAPDRCDKVVDSFARLLQVLRRQKPNNLLLGTLRAGERGSVRERQTEVFDRVVVGSKWVSVFLPGDCCPPEPSFDENFDDGELIFGRR